MTTPQVRYAPPLSIVLVILGDAASITEWLRALAAQEDAPPYELVVPHDASTLAALKAVDFEALPWLHFEWVEVAGDHVEPSILRGAGVRAARGHVVAVIEDHTLPDRHWVRNVMRAHDEPHAAIGGVVEKQLPDGALGWAMYLLDYGRYMPPLAAGARESLTSCNVSYKVVALDRVAHAWPAALRETDVHWALRHAGETLWLDPSIVVRQRRSLSLGRALVEWFGYGREFASARARAESKAKSVVRVGLAPALPALFAARAWATLGRAPHRVGIFVRALPALIALGAAWAAGEVAGALRPLD